MQFGWQALHKIQSLDMYHDCVNPKVSLPIFSHVNNSIIAIIYQLPFVCKVSKFFMKIVIVKNSQANYKAVCQLKRVISA